MSGFTKDIGRTTSLKSLHTLHTLQSLQSLHKPASDVGYVGLCRV